LNDLDLASEYIVQLVDEMTLGDALQRAFLFEAEVNEARRALLTFKSLEDVFRSALKASPFYSLSVERQTLTHGADGTDER
jgi:hypothetical protein